MKSVHDVMTGAVSVEKLLSGRRRGRKKAPLVVVETRVEFDDEASSSHSTLLEVVTQDTTGLLRALEPDAGGATAAISRSRWLIRRARRRSTCSI